MKTPLAPPGTKCLVHAKVSQRGSWAPNGEEGWTISYSPEHYRCIKIYFPKTRSERDCDTITFFPTVIPYPEVKLEHFLKQAASDIITILTTPPSTTTPSLQAGDTTKNALLDIATILHRADDLPSTSTDMITPLPQRVHIEKKECTSSTPKNKIKIQQASATLQRKKKLGNEVLLHPTTVTD